MRVNVDSKALSEPRVRRLAKRLGITHFEALGRLLHVWMLCYERRSEVVPLVDCDTVADMDGFGAAMAAEDLADVGHATATELRIRGVSERIEFLSRQAERGRASARNRVTKTSSTSPNANVRSADVERTLNERCDETLHSTPKVNERSRRPSTNSPDHAPDLAPAPDPDGRAPRPPREDPDGAQVAIDLGPSALGGGSKGENQTPPGKPEGRNGKVPRSLLSATWQPTRNEANLAAEREVKAAGVDLRAELLALRDWAASKAERGADWDARWRNWIREAARRRAKEQRYGPRSSSDGLAAVLRIANGEDL